MRHERGALYTAIVGYPERPWAHLDVRLEVPLIGVHFPDEQLREELLYVFSRAPESEDELFLEQATWSYYGSSVEVEFEWFIAFAPSGLARVTTRDCVADEQARYDVDTTEVVENREPVPAFGDYTSIARRER